MNIHPLAIVLLIIGCGGCGFLFGILHERGRWNELIKCGVLPKPFR